MKFAILMLYDNLRSCIAQDKICDLASPVIKTSQLTDSLHCLK